MALFGVLMIVVFGSFVSCSDECVSLKELNSFQIEIQERIAKLVKDQSEDVQKLSNEILNLKNAVNDLEEKNANLVNENLNLKENGAAIEAHSTARDFSRTSAAERLEDDINAGSNDPSRILHVRDSGNVGPATVAFSASVNDTIYDVGFRQNIPFTSVTLDNANSFHGESGIFTAPRTGLFVFFVGITCPENSYLEFEIVKDGLVLTSSHCQNQSVRITTPASTIVELQVGDKVWVRVKDNTHSAGNIVVPEKFSVFHGYNIH